MNRYRIEVQQGSPRWVSIGIFRAKTAAGALQQAARDLPLLPNTTAIRAEMI